MHEWTKLPLSEDEKEDSQTHKTYTRVVSYLLALIMALLLSWGAYEFWLGFQLLRDDSGESELKGLAKENNKFLSKLSKRYNAGGKPYKLEDLLSSGEPGECAHHHPHGPAHDHRHRHHRHRHHEEEEEVKPTEGETPIEQEEPEEGQPDQTDVPSAEIEEDSSEGRARRHPHRAGLQYGHHHHHRHHHKHPHKKGPHHDQKPSAAAQFVSGKKQVVEVDVKGERRTAVVYVPKSLEAAPFQSPWYRRRAVMHPSAVEAGEVESAVPFEEGIPEAWRRAAPSGAPLILLFHGLGDNCDSFLNKKWMNEAEEHATVIVSACGMAGLLGAGWNAGTCCGFEGKNKPDDIAFARTLVESLKAPRSGTTFPSIEAERVAAVGFSNGAMLSEVLACTAPDVIRASVSVGGVVEMRPGNKGGLEACTAAMEQKRIEVQKGLGVHLLLIHGDNDWKVPWTGNSVLGFPAIQENFEGWLDRQGCDVTVHRQWLSSEAYTNDIYESCMPMVKNDETGELPHDTPTVELVRAHGAGHTWPSDKEFDTVSYTFSFLSRVFRN